MHAIEAVALTKSFDNLTAVDRLNLTVEEGEIFGLVGPDGAGKTTTMRLLTSIMEPTSGEAWVAGHNVLREARGGQGRDRLHEPAVWPLPGSDSDGEP